MKTFIKILVITYLFTMSILDIRACPGQCTGDWNNSTTPLSADTNDCGILVNYRWRECIIGGQKIREVEITSIEMIPGGNCENTSISALLAIATKAVLFYSSGIFMVDNPATPYDVILYTPACWRASTPTNLVPCNNDFCCTNKVTMQTVDGWPQATNQIIMPPNPQNCSGIVGQTCDYICDAQSVPLNEPLIPWHFDYSWLCDSGCPGDLYLGSGEFTYNGNDIFFAYAAIGNCYEQGCPPDIRSGNDFYRIQIIHLQIVNLINPVNSFYELLFQTHKRCLRVFGEHLRANNQNINNYFAKLFVRQCWKPFGQNGPNDYVAYPCNPPSECCFRYFNVSYNGNCWQIQRRCPPVIYEPNECDPPNPPCTYGCNWLFSCINGEPWSYCDLLNDAWTIGECLPKASDFEIEVTNLPLQQNVNVHKENISDNLSFNIESTLSEQVNLQLFDALGNLVLAKQLSLEKGQNNINLSNMKLPNGLYFYNITLDNSVLLYGKFIYIK